MKDYQIDGNKEMVALGTMNVVGSFTSCYVATGTYTLWYNIVSDRGHNLGIYLALGY